jgi:hypothetical protein
MLTDRTATFVKATRSSNCSPSTSHDKQAADILDQKRTSASTPTCTLQAMPRLRHHQPVAPR